ncbi:aspartyl-phosphate phosphatase Spo0E family protein [Methylomusa anaerophila]|uniref:Spo0E like sporulation regulatory protein n=1 Tax=Methylomusa anaerophila TaxID=1930071 RepID=A0A348AI85_9FIRM|nr:aspartyl-phosphate phosphatase Spo0E family protein [Methylomusa anaerophila]BBB90783.1 hypothetical protein MAMMFC1_01444 [Methylomusa anaerophila]
MFTLTEQEKEIESVRHRLHELVKSKNGNFTDKDVAELSMVLDKLIVAYERSRQRRHDKIEVGPLNY